MTNYMLGSYRVCQNLVPIYVTAAEELYVLLSRSLYSCIGWALEVENLFSESGMWLLIYGT